MAPPGAGTGSRAGEQPGLQLSVGDVVGQRPGQLRRLEPADRQPHRRRGCPHPPRNLTDRHPGRLQSDHIAHMAHRKPLRWHPKSPFAKPKGGTVSEPEEAASPRATSSRNSGRDHLGMAGEIKSERWARSFRNGGRHRAESALMRRMGIEALYRRPRTTKAEPGHKIHPYLLRGLEITRPNQVWAMDITYIPMAHGFVYLAVVLDWATRRVLSWRLSITMEAAFCVETLEDA